MLAHFAFREPQSQRPRSVLCRVLDGRGLEEVCQSDAAILTTEERAYYQATLRNPKSRALAVRARAELRRMLARETGLPPHKVPIISDTKGELRCTHTEAADLGFSVSQTEECAIIAIGEAAGLGVAVEEVLHEYPSEENLEIVFNEAEFRAWTALPLDQRRLAFTQAWTIKEAALKASGMDFNGDTHEVTVLFDAAGNALPVLPSQRWIFERIHFSPRYAASFIAVLPEGGQSAPQVLGASTRPMGAIQSEVLAFMDWLSPEKTETGALDGFRTAIRDLASIAERAASLLPDNIEYAHQVSLFWAGVGRLKDYLGISNSISELVSELRTARFQFLGKDTPPQLMQAMVKAFETVEQAKCYDEALVDDVVSLLEQAGVDSFAPDQLRSGNE